MKNRNFKNYKSAPNKSAQKKVPMKQDDLKNKIYAWILLVAMVFWSIGSVLGIIAFASKKTANNGVITASAEEVSTVAETEDYSFNSVLFGGFTFGTNSSAVNTIASGLKIRPIFDENDIIDGYEVDTFDLDGNVLTTVSPTGGAVDCTFAVNVQGVMQNWVIPLTFSYLGGVSSSDLIFQQEKISYNFSDVLRFDYLRDGSVDLTLLFDLSSVINLSYGAYLYSPSVGKLGGFSPNKTVDLSYYQGYTLGESAGYDNGYAEGESAGYDNGYVKGQLQGYEQSRNGFFSGDFDITFYTNNVNNFINFNSSEIVVNGGTINFDQFSTSLLEFASELGQDTFNCTGWQLSFNGKTSYVSYSQFKLYGNLSRFSSLQNNFFDSGNVVELYVDSWSVSNRKLTSWIFDEENSNYVLSLASFDDDDLIVGISCIYPNIPAVNLFSVSSGSENIGIILSADTSLYYSGYNVGYENGYTNGVAESNEYSFAGLLGAVIDVPVKTFTSLFNFEILGVNLSSFFYALLTVATILTIVKLVL